MPSFASFAVVYAEMLALGCERSLYLPVIRYLLPGLISFRGTPDFVDGYFIAFKEFAGAFFEFNFVRIFILLRFRVAA